MATYILYSYQMANGDLDTVAILEAAVDESVPLDRLEDLGYDGPSPPSAFVPPGTKDIERVGRIDAVGDDHLLADSFSVM